MAVMIFRNMTDFAEREAAAAFLGCNSSELSYIPTPLEINYWNGRAVRVFFAHFTYGTDQLYGVTGLMDERILYAADAAGADLAAIVSTQTQMLTNRDWVEETFPHLRGKLGDPSRFDRGKWWEEHPLLDAHGPWMTHYLGG